MRIVIWTVVYCMCFGSVFGSNGDVDPQFYYCVRGCYQRRGDLAKTTYRQVFYWDDISECQYKCMREISDTRMSMGQSTLKYFGHWPYYRIYGLQEPASCLFSFLNAIPHAYNLLLCRPRFASTKYYMSGWLVAYGCVAIFAWLCSTAFHARKIGITIDLDYMSALVFLSFGLWIAIRRTLAIVFITRPVLVAGCFVLWIVAVAYQLRSMMLGNVPFGDHMKVSITIAALQCAIWVIWSLSRPNPHWKTCLLVQTWFAAASSLEIFDFPPVLSHFDAHALWHAATIPLGFLWYYYWQQDAAYFHELCEVNVGKHGESCDVGMPTKEE